MQRQGRKRHNRPEKLIAYSFICAIIAGCLLLKLPFSAKSGHMSFIDALFTATSAVCVTGLSVIDIGKDLTFTGQAFMLVLIQAGGLGIMTLSVLFFLMLGKRTSFTSRLSLGNISLDFDPQSMKRTLGLVLATTFIFEFAGAALLYGQMSRIHTFPMAVFSSVFHAVSAFCNSGFSLYSDSLTRFQGQIYVPVVIMALVVTGGLGFMVISEFYEGIIDIKNRKRFRLSLHSKIALTGTACLLVLGAAVIFALEQKNLFAGMPAVNKAVNAVFLSVTSRTAGFNTVDTGMLSNATLFFVIMLMFIGGCPGSTAGGIKVNTFVVLFAVLAGKLKGDLTTSIYKRKIPPVVIDKTVAIFSASLFVLCLFLFLFLMSENIWVSHTVSKGSFLELFFESASAFGTVGLSVGATAKLSTLGKLLTVFLMFAGRVGPITLAVALQTMRRKRLKYEYAEEEIMVG